MATATKCDNKNHSSRERRWMGFAISLVVLICALYVVLSRNYDDNSKKWAAGIIGTILGWWGKP